MQDLNDEIRINHERIHLYSSSRIYDENHNDEKSCSIPVKVKRSMDMRNFQEKFNRSLSIKQLQILPDKCKYFEQFSNKKLYVIEEKPSIRTIKMMLPVSMELNYLKNVNKIDDPEISKYFNTNKNNWKKETPINIRSYTLSMPYVVFIITLDHNNQYLSTWVYLRLAPLVGKNDYLLAMPFCNIDDNEQICMGSHASLRANTEQQAIKNVIDTFWHAVYNQDYTYGIQKYQNEEISGVASYVEWEVMTKNDPNFIYGVDWISDSRNIGSKINHIKEIYNSSRLVSFFNKVKSAISQPVRIDETVNEVRGDGTIISQPLYYDITNGIRPRNDNEIYLHVGDPFYIKNKKAFCFISSFLGTTSGTGDIDYIQVERNDGKFFKYKFTKKVREFLLEQGKAVRDVDQAELNNGTIIKAGDILIDPEHTYKQIEYIRRTPYNTIEVKFVGSNFYNLDKIEAELRDPNAPVIFEGTEITKDKTYLVTFYRSENNALLTSSLKMKFYDFLIRTFTNELNIKMLRIDTNVSSTPITLEKLSNNVFDLDDIEVIDDNPYFYNGRALRVCHSRFDEPKDEKIIKTSEGITFDNDKCIINQNIDYAHLEKQIIKDKKLHITGFNTDVDFSKGDKVVVADWVNPQNMLVCKEIVEFIINIEQRVLSFKLKDASGKIDIVPYIDNNNIKIGKIRHITIGFDKLKFTDKIRAKVAGICNFPKKDINMIIGFLTDTGGQPLVLCSNGCTLWYEDVLEQFEIFTSEHKAWERLSAAGLDVDKIKIQPGDLIVINRSSYLVGNIARHNHFKPFPEMHISYVRAKEQETNFKFDNFLAPRMLQKDIIETRYSNNLVPNYLGTYKKVKLKFSIEFPINERSIVNV